MWITCDGLKSYSTITNQQPVILSHVQELLKEPQLWLPCMITSLSCSDGTLTADDPLVNGHYYVQWSSESKQLRDSFKSRLHIKKALATIAGISYWTDALADMIIDMQTHTEGTPCTAYGNGRIRIPQLAPDPWCFITCHADNNQISFSLHNATHTCQVAPLLITRRTDGWWFQLDGQLPVSYFIALGMVDPSLLPCEVVLTTNMSGTLDADYVQGTITIPPTLFLSQSNPLCVDAAFEKKGSVIAGEATIGMSGVLELTGNWLLDTTDLSGTFCAKNSAVLCNKWCTPWQVLPGNAFIQGTFGPDTGLKATYQAGCTQSSSCAQHTILGSMNCSRTIYNIQGTIDGTQLYELQCASTYPYLHHILYKQDEKTTAINIQSYSNGITHCFSGMCTLAFARNALRTTCNYELQADGMLTVEGEFFPTGARGRAVLTESTIRVLQTNNFINGFEGNFIFDWKERKLIARDVCCTLHEGLMRIAQAAFFADEQWQVYYAHAPIVLDRCVLQVKKDLFAMVSGSLFAEYRREDALPFIKGSVIFDRAQLKENIFADEFQKQLFELTVPSGKEEASDIACDIVVHTKEPIRVDTPFLKTNARVALHLSRSLRNPQVIGKIKLLGGELHFPHKPLHITRGTIEFLPDQLNNPQVELVAKNSIKKNNITLYVSGSLLNHQIMLESTPPLTQEQIISLLLVGSHDDTLNSMMPAFLAHNIKSLIFGGHTSGILEKYFRPVLPAFNINLVPSFSDQTGRGGLRGAIEITVNDRWRALIQKNFSLTEDTRFEVEYLFSDDISVRAIRDERKDMGAEIEVRWKF
jgi:hypothetical protein